MNLMDKENLKLTSCLGKIQSGYSSFSDASRKVADYILSNSEKAIHMTIVQLSELCDVSEASIVRFCQTVGYTGFNDLKINLAAEMNTGNQMILEDVSEMDDEKTIFMKVFNSEIQALQNTLQALDSQHFMRAVNSIVFSNRVEFFSYGNSRPIVEDTHYRFLRIGINSRIGVDVSDSLIHATMLTQGDIAIGVSHSGSTKHTVKMLEEARSRGATTICLTGFERSPITKVADICLISKSRETTFTDIAMASRIAQMAIMDALFVAVAFKRLERSKQYIRMTDKILSEEKF